MKKKICLLILLPLTLHARQSSTGIHFEHGLNWQAVQKKANATDKYIFMDCNASWCRPCKMMEREIFTQEKVGNYLDDKFISVTVQMDTSKWDNEEVKRWYADARTIMQQYKISAFPTFLFFSPKGKLIHRATGYKNVDEFLALAADAANPARQYYTLLDKYKQGKIADSSLAYLARTANILGEPDLAHEAAKEYTNRLQEGDLFTKDNIEFMQSFTQSSKDKGFNLLYQYADKVDTVMGVKHYSQGLIDYIIAKEEIDPIMIPATECGSSPDWNKIRATISRKYDATYADRTIISAKTRWYRFKKNYPNFTKFLILYVEKYGRTMSNFDLNNNAWSIFKYSNDKNELSVALSWSKRTLDNEPTANRMDTYANILYKLGKTEDAMQWETKALSRAIEMKIDGYIKDFSDNLEKMKKSQPTWSTK